MVLVNPTCSARPPTPPRSCRPEKMVVLVIATGGRLLPGGEHGIAWLRHGLQAVSVRVQHVSAGLGTSEHHGADVPLAELAGDLAHVGHAERALDEEPGQHCGKSSRLGDWRATPRSVRFGANSIVVLPASFGHVQYRSR